MNRIVLLVFSVLIILVLTIQGHGKTENNNFESKRITKSATITLNGTLDDVFPLFGAREEQKWAPQWKPEFIYPKDKPDEKNNIFTVEHKGHGNQKGTVSYCVITEFSKKLSTVSYAIFSDHYITTISIQCNAVADSTTKAHVEYNWTSLDDHGSILIERKSEMLFSDYLASWEGAINLYLKESSK